MKFIITENFTHRNMRIIKHAFTSVKVYQCNIASSWLSAYNQNTGHSIQHPKSTPINLFATSNTSSWDGWKLHIRTVMQKNTPVSTMRYGKIFWMDRLTYGPIYLMNKTTEKCIQPCQKVTYKFSRAHKENFLIINRTNIIYQMVSNC
jgi:hypothetical protein